MKTKVLRYLAVAILTSALLLPAQADETNAILSLPNLATGKSAERFLGVGAPVPYPYFQKPRYRYPVYDSEGRGSLVYGYGGKDVYRYTSFTPIEGHH